MKNIKKSDSKLKVNISSRKTDIEGKRTYFIGKKKIGSIMLSEFFSTILINNKLYQIEYKLRKNIKDYTYSYILTLSKNLFISNYNRIREMLDNTEKTEINNKPISKDIKKRFFSRVFNLSKVSISIASIFIGVL